MVPQSTIRQVYANVEASGGHIKKFFPSKEQSKASRIASRPKKREEACQNETPANQFKIQRNDKCIIKLICTAYNYGDA